MNVRKLSTMSHGPNNFLNKKWKKIKNKKNKKNKKKPIQGTSF